MIDLHTHILPDVDDGIKNREEAFSAAKNALKQGITKIVATPHYLEDGYRLNQEETRERTAVLQEYLTSRGLNIEIMTGAEIHITPDIASKVNDKEVSTINNSRYILLELPPAYLPDYTNRVLYNLNTTGYIPVIAHPERYLPVIKDPNILYHWAKNRVYAQLNAGSLMGIYGVEVKETAEILVKHRLVQFIGSDLHSDGRRSRCFQDALRKIKTISSMQAERMLKNNELAVSDEVIPIPKVKKYKNSKFKSKLKKIIGLNIF